MFGSFWQLLVRFRKGSWSEWSSFMVQHHGQGQQSLSSLLWEEWSFSAISICFCQTNGILAHWDYFVDYLVLKNGTAPEKRSKCMKYIFHRNNNLDFFFFLVFICITKQKKSHCIIVCTKIVLRELKKTHIHFNLYLVRCVNVFKLQKQFGANSKSICHFSGFWC